MWRNPTAPRFLTRRITRLGGPPKANEEGTVHFSFVTRFTVYDTTIARTFAEWTLVVQQLGLAGQIVQEAHCVVTLTSQETTLAGAALAVSPAVATVGSNRMVSGGGFAPNEMGNLWVTPPFTRSESSSLP